MYINYSTTALNVSTDPADLQTDNSGAILVHDLDDEHRLRNQEAHAQLVDASSYNLQSLLDGHVFLPVAIED